MDFRYPKCIHGGIAKVALSVICSNHPAYETSRHYSCGQGGAAMISKHSDSQIRVEGVQFVNSNSRSSDSLSIQCRDVGILRDLRKRRAKASCAE